VKITTISSFGKEAVVAILSAGDFFGEDVWPLSRGASPQLGRLSHPRYGVWTKWRWCALCMKSRVSELFMAYLLARNIRIESDLIDHLFNSSEKRAGETAFVAGEFW